MTTNNRRMPSAINLGQMLQGPMSSAMRFHGCDRINNPNGLRTVMGFILPPWQRGFVWTEPQCVRFIESLWLGVPVGTYSVNLLFGSQYDGWLIDGQQRMRALERYLAGDFPVLGWKWPDVTEVDRRVFGNLPWPYFQTSSKDEQYLAGYYNLLNFGGTGHIEDERAEIEAAQP